MIICTAYRLSVAKEAILESPASSLLTKVSQLANMLLGAHSYQWWRCAPLWAVCPCYFYNLSLTMHISYK